MTTETKAERLLAAGRVHVRDAHHVVVDGDTGRYRVTFEDRWRCDCTAFAWRSTCAHVRAVIVVTSPPPEQWTPPTW